MCSYTISVTDENFHGQLPPYQLWQHPFINFGVRVPAEICSRMLRTLVLASPQSVLKCDELFTFLTLHQYPPASDRCWFNQPAAVRISHVFHRNVSIISLDNIKANTSLTQAKLAPKITENQINFW